MRISLRSTAIELEMIEKYFQSYQPDIPFAAIKELEEASDKIYQPFSDKTFTPYIDHPSGRFLHFMTLLKQPKKILEIGFGAGCSALWMHFACPSAHITSLDKNPVRYRNGIEFLKNNSYPITLYPDDAREFLKESQGPWDLVFMDGVKSQYQTYFELLLAQLAPGAFVIADNVLYRGKVWENGLSPKKRREIRKLKKFSENIANHSDFTTIFVPVGDGMSLSLKKS